MTDESHGWGAPGVGAPVPVASTPAGWYPDPWSNGHHRYWDGMSWTGGSFPHGVTRTWDPEGSDATPGYPVPPPRVGSGYDAAPPPPPQWAPPSSYQGWMPPTDTWAPAQAPAEPAPTRSWFSSGAGFVALVVAVMLVVGALGTLGGYLAFRHRSAPAAASGPPFSSAPPGPGSSRSSDPSASALDSLVVQQADVPSTVVVQPDPNSGQFSAAAATLNLCNGTFPSESLRTARVQVTAYDGTATALLSTEAVLYNQPASADQAFSELKSVAAGCPSTPVQSPIGDPTASFQFNPAPDGAWAATPTVTRLAYDFVATDELGATQHSVAIYLHRGRALMGIYFFAPDSPQISVAGQTTIEKIAGVFAARLAALPASAVNG